MSSSPVLSLYGTLYGSFFFGTIMSAIFYGVSCMQTFFYYVHYPNDRLRMKIFVAFCWVVNTTHEGLNVAGVYKYIMAGLSDVSLASSPFLQANPEILLQILLTILVTIPTRGFFVYRGYVFSGKNMTAPVVWVILAVAQFSSAIIYIGKALYIDDGLQVVRLNVLSDQSFMTLATICLAVGVAMDILIAIFLTFLLFHKRASNSLSRSTNTGHIMQRLTVFAVNTGIWPALFSLLTVVLLHAFPSNMLYAIFYLPLCSVYCNTLLANLNARAYIGGEGTLRHQGEMPDVSCQKTGRSELDFAPREGVWMTTDTVTYTDTNRLRINPV